METGSGFACEILGSHRIEELAEPLDFGFFILVLPDLDTSLFENFHRCEERGFSSCRQGDGI